MHQHQHIGIYEIILSSLADTYLMIPVLFVLYLILEYFSHTKQLDLISKLKISGPLGPLAGTLLGIIPQCGMSVFVTTMFLSRRVTLGTLVATYLATSDEALPVFIAHRSEGMMILYIIGLKFLIGIISGYAVDLLFGNKLYDGLLPEVKSSHAVEIKHQEARPMQFRTIARRVLEERYLRRDPAGRVVETPEELFSRVARGVAAAEARYGGSEAVARQTAAFFEAMAGLKFLPNTPTLMNADLPMGQLAACFVIPVLDDMRSIMDAVRAMALVHQTGGGTGFSFTHLRPRGDQVRSTGRVASGPVGFMWIFDVTNEVVKQGGRRRGANMGILNEDHPDILEFIKVKADLGQMTNFNLSVAVTDAFMEKVERGAWECRATAE